MRPLAMALSAVALVAATLVGSSGSAATSARVYLPITARNVGFDDASSPQPTSAPATGTPTSTARTPTSVPTATAARAATAVATATPTATTSSVDRTKLPLGDGKYSTSAKKDYTMTCTTSYTGGGAFADGPWINTSAGTYNSLAKAIVDGTVTWSSHNITVTKSGSTRTIVSNDLPSHTTGTYPIASTDDAYNYDRNPHSITSQSISVSLNANPSVASTPGCTGGGAIGIMLTGTVFFNPLDEGGRDAPAHEVLDSCQGHPQSSGMYHYHNLSDCVTSSLDSGSGHSNLVGYAYDGFGIYGLRGSSGSVVSNSDLDECHGHTHSITWDGTTTSMYHYHATYEYPYLVGCFKGGTVRSSSGPRAAASWRPAIR